jgi:uncharacterized membrane protein required for colicin V production
MKFHLLDWGILIIFLVGIFSGYRSGLIRQAIHLFGFFLSFIAAFLLYDDVAPLLRRIIPYPQTNKPSFFSYLIDLAHLEDMFYSAISFGLLFFITKWALVIIANMFDLIASFPVINTVNRVSGAVIGLCSTFMLLFVLIHILLVIPSPSLHQYLSKSSLVQLLTEKSPFFTDQLQDFPTSSK